MAWGAPRGIDDIIARVRANDASLASLYLMRQRRFELADANALCAALVENTLLDDLNISSHAVSPEIAAAFASLLASTAALKSLDLGNASFGDQGLSALCPGIASSRSLLRLNLENKGLTASGCIHLAEALATNSSLQELILTRNNIGEQGLAALCPALGTLQILSLTECGLSGTDSGAILSTLLSTSSSLKVLRLEDNTALDANFMNALSPGLAVSSSLQELYLRGCPLQSEGIATLFFNLPSALSHLDISGTDLGTEGLISATVALAERSGGAQLNLRRLVACGCGGDDLSIGALIVALTTEQCCSSQGIYLDFSGNAAGLLTLTALAHCPQLRAVCLHDCKLGFEGGDALYYQILGLNVAVDDSDDEIQAGTFFDLQELDISANALESTQLVNILDALQTTSDTCCPTLRQLVIAANPGAMEKDVTDAIERLQAVRTGLDVVRRSADTGERDGHNNNNNNTS